MKRIDNQDFVDIEFVCSQCQQREFLRCPKEKYGTTLLPEEWNRIPHKIMDNITANIISRYMDHYKFNDSFKERMDNINHIVCKDCYCNLQAIDDIIT